MSDADIRRGVRALLAGGLAALPREALDELTRACRAELASRDAGQGALWAPTDLRPRSVLHVWRPYAKLPWERAGLYRAVCDRARSLAHSYVLLARAENDPRASRRQCAYCVRSAEDPRVLTVAEATEARREADE